jgi:hypothetical protein
MGLVRDSGFLDVIPGSAASGDISPGSGIARILPDVARVSLEKPDILR